jgi:hypothetical protein
VNIPRRRPTRLESTIAIVLIAVPVIVLIVIFNLQQKPDISRFGIQTPITEKPQSRGLLTKDKSTIDLGLLAPQGFAPFGPGESYVEETLYEKINGKAPLYTESGFVKLHTQRYVNVKDEELTFELYLYDMSSAANAFSVYSIQRRAQSSPIVDMPFAYRTDNALYLTHGRYYCELIGSSDSPLILDALDFTATALVESLKDAGPIELPQLALFPTENLTPDTFILYLNGAFGFDGLTNTFSARYNINNETITAFISKQSNDAAAKKLLDRYHQFLLDNGGEEIASSELPAKYIDFYGSLEIASVENSFIFGIHQAEDRTAAETILALIRDRLMKESQ